MSTPSLRITLVSETFPPEINGVATTLGRLVEGLRQRGHRVQVLRPRQTVDLATPPGPQVLLSRGRSLPGYPGLQWGEIPLGVLLREWGRERPDVLYIATEGPLGLNALRAARRLNIAVISGFHTNFAQYAGHYGFGLLTRPLTHYLRWFHRRTLLTLVPSPSQRTELERRDFERLALLSRGVDASLFTPGRRNQALRDRWGIGPDDTVVLHVGRLATEKNLGLLRPCLLALHRAHPERRMRLVIVGDGPQRAVLEQQLPEAVFCGAQQGEALAEHYASGDLFLFPSLSETFGNVVLEAMASGLGVVAYDQAAAAQHIRHGDNGVLAMPGDQNGFIEAASWLLEENEHLRRVRLNARWHASRQGWSTIVEQFEGYLREACRPSSRALGAVSGARPTVGPDLTPSPSAKSLSPK